MEISGKLIDQTPVISPEFGECVFAKIQLPAVRVEDIKAGDTIWSQKIVPDNEPLKHFLSRHDNIAAHFPKFKPMPFIGGRVSDMPTKSCEHETISSSFINGKVNNLNCVYCGRKEK